MYVPLHKEEGAPMIVNGTVEHLCPITFRLTNLSQLTGIKRIQTRMRAGAQCVNALKNMRAVQTVEYSFKSGFRFSPMLRYCFRYASVSECTGLPICRLGKLLLFFLPLHFFDDGLELV